MAAVSVRGKLYLVPMSTLTIAVVLTTAVADTAPSDNGAECRALLARARAADAHPVLFAYWETVRFSLNDADRARMDAIDVKGTSAGRGERLAYLALDRAIRGFAPLLLDGTGRSAAAQELRGLPAVTGLPSLRAAAKVSDRLARRVREAIIDPIKTGNVGDMIRGDVRSALLVASEATFLGELRKPDFDGGCRVSEREHPAILAGFLASNAASSALGVANLGLGDPEEVRLAVKPAVLYRRAADATLALLVDLAAAARAPRRR